MRLSTSIIATSAYMCVGGLNKNSSRCSALMFLVVPSQKQYAYKILSCVGTYVLHSCNMHEISVYRKG